MVAGAWLGSVTCALALAVAGCLTASQAQTVLAGAQPQGKLAQAADGTVYGTTKMGSQLVPGCQFVYSSPVGCGTLFRINTDGSASTIYSFAPGDGYGPQDVIAGTDGNLYGFLSLGSINYQFYKITPSGSFTSLIAPTSSQGVVYAPGPLEPFGASFFAPGCLGNGIGPTIGMIFSTSGDLSTFPVTAPTQSCYFAGQPTMAVSPAGNTYVFNSSITAISPSGRSKFISTNAFTIGGKTYYIFGYSGGYVDAAGQIYVPATNVYSTPQGNMSQGVILKVSSSGKGSIFVKFPLNEVPEYLMGTSSGTMYGIVIGGASGSNGALFSLSPTKVLSVAHQFGTVSSAPIPCVTGANRADLDLRHGRRDARRGTDACVGWHNLGD